MVVINKNFVAAFGKAIFGRGVLGLDFTSQNIPSESYDYYIRAVALARYWGTVGRRYPWHVNQEATPDQDFVRVIFREACDCFAIQPDEGGVEPPAIGPRNRSWWYDNDPGIDPIYFNYFMQQTLLSLFDQILPDWCRSEVSEDSYVGTALPDGNHGSDWETELIVHRHGELEKVSRIWLKTPIDIPKTIYLYCQHLGISGGLTREIEVCRQLPGTWNENTITWNNQPAIGTRIISFPSGSISQGNWLSISVGDAVSVCIKFIDESIPGDGQTIDAVFTSIESENINKRPYVSLI